MQNALFFIRRNVKDIVIFGLIFIIMGLVLYKFYFNSSQDDIVEIANIEKTDFTSNNLVDTEKIENNFYVDIKGAVKNPGVYQVESNSIVNDVISLAGGFNSNAYKDGINLSKKITDEMVIYVYTKSEIKEKSNSNIEVSLDNTCKMPSYSICECVDNKESIIESGDSSNSGNSFNNDDNKGQSLVNINTAGVAELTSLSGIGESKAKAIIEYRSTNGNFSDISDIMKVSGIGESVFVKIKDYITV